MNILIIQSTSAFMLSIILLLVIQVINHQSPNSRNKNSPFECGFDPNESARLPFSLRFFLLAIVFLIFDIEIALLFPLILSMKIHLIKTSTSAGTLFLTILMVGVIHEWKQGTLSWVK